MEIYDREGQKVKREVHEGNFEHDAADKGQYRHYMQKEIFEQPVAIMNTLDGRIVNGKVNINAIGANATEFLQKVEHITANS